jgi:hypothetical protein
MTVDDPDDNQDPVTHRWAAFTCPDDTAIAGCSPLEVGGLQSGVSTLELPASLVSVHSIFIDFRASDQLGATDSDAMVFLVNDAPTLELGTSAGSFVVGAPVALFATYGDLDAGPGDVTLRWEIVSPDARPAVLADLDVVPGDMDPAHATVGKTFVPDSGGNWLLTVTATDSFDESHEEQLSIPVDPETASRPTITIAPSMLPPGQRSVASWR